MPPTQPGSSGEGSLQGRATALLRSPGFTKVWRYGAVSVVSTVVTLVALYVFYRVIRVGSAGEANVFATAIATVPSYYLNRTWAWGKTGKSHLWREMVPFWVIAAVGLVLSTLAVELASREAHHLSHAHQVQTALVEVANLFTYAVMWVGKFLVFNRVLFKKETPVSLPVASGSFPASGEDGGGYSAGVG